MSESLPYVLSEVHQVKTYRPQNKCNNNIQVRCRKNWRDLKAEDILKGLKKPCYEDGIVVGCIVVSLGKLFLVSLTFRSLMSTVVDVPHR